jgi:hypothetical protein
MKDTKYKRCTFFFELHLKLIILYFHNIHFRTVEKLLFNIKNNLKRIFNQKEKTIITITF